MTKLIFYILFKFSKLTNLSHFLYKFYIIISKPLSFLSKILKAKKNKILENSNLSESYFRKIYPEFDEYINDFRTIFNSNTLFSFTLDKEQNLIKELINKEFKDFKESLIIKANDILKNKFLILGKKVNFNKSIDWFYSFYENFDWPLIQINQLKKIINKKEKDAKYTLRLNYHEELVILGLAYYLTNNEIYALKFEKLILDWIEKNPPNLGINWIDLLEISHRVVNWIFSLLLFGKSLSLNNNSLKKIAKSLYHQVYYIKLHSNPYSYNHTIGEYFAIFLFSKIFNKFNSINNWYSQSLTVLNKQIKKQIQEDGVHIEQSTHYHRLVLEIFILLLIIEPKIRSSNNLKLIKKMLIFLKYVIKPDGTIPQIGDSDNSHFLPEILLNGKKWLNYTILNLGAAFFEDSEFKIVENNSESFIIVLLLGSSKFLKFKMLKKANLQEKIKYFDQSGYLICKNELSKTANYLFFDMGNFGPYPSSHDHSDISNLIYSFNGNPILIDSGTYKYNESQKSRNLFRSGKAHNIIVVNNYNQAKIIDKWTWINIPNIKRKISYHKDIIKASICHKGYKNFVSEREIETTKDFCDLKIIDKIYPIKTPRLNWKVTSYLHFPPNVKLEILNNNIMINSTIFLSVKCENSILKLIKTSFLTSPYYGILKKSLLIEFVIINNFNNIEPIKIIYHFHKSEINRLE